MDQVRENGALACQGRAHLLVLDNVLVAGLHLHA